MRSFKFVVLAFVLFSGLFSCITQKDYVLLRRTPNYDSTFVPPFTPYKIQDNDILAITVVSTDQESAKLFTKSIGGGNATNARNALSEQGSFLNGFSLNDSGYVVIPILGAIQAKGLTVSEFRDTIQAKMNHYFKFAIVDVKIANYRITFMGEFNKTEPLLVYRNKINMIEALALSGGFTDFAKRREVLVYRNINGQTHMRKVDFTSIDITHHEWFYLMPNDVLYAEPVKIKALKVNLTTISFVTSLISFGLLFVNLANRYK